jgi:hypothetical protein
MSLEGGRTDAEQPGFNNRLDGENTAEGPRPEDDRGAPARSRPLPRSYRRITVPLPRVDERRHKELRCFTDVGDGRVLAGGRDRRTRLTRAGRSDLRRLR